MVASLQGAVGAEEGLLDAIEGELRPVLEVVPEGGGHFGAVEGGLVGCDVGFAECHFAFFVVSEKVGKACIEVLERAIFGRRPEDFAEGGEAGEGHVVKLFNIV